MYLIHNIAYEKVSFALTSYVVRHSEHIFMFSCNNTVMHAYVRERWERHRQREFHSDACLFEREMRETETKRVSLFVFLWNCEIIKNGPVPTLLWVVIIDNTIMTPMKHSVGHISGFPQQFYFQLYVKWRSCWKYLSFDQSQRLMLEIESDIMRHSV